MFNNMGKKLKALAGIIAGFGMGFSIIYFIVLIKEDLLKVGATAVVLIAVLSLIGAFLIAGFGQLVENSDKLVKLKEAENSKAAETSSEDEEPAVSNKSKKETTAKASEKSKKEQNSLTVSSFLEDKIKKIVATKKDKEESLKQANPDWCEEIEELTDKELVKRIDNDHDWQHKYVVLCCFEYNKRLKAKKK